MTAKEKFKQRLAGVTCIAFGAVTIPLTGGDGTIFIFMLFPAIAAFTSKKYI